MRRLHWCLALSALASNASAQTPPAATSPTPPAPPTASPAAAVETEAGFSVEDAIAAMRRAHPILAAARAGVRAAGSDVVSAGLWTNPVLNFNYTRSFGFTTYHPVVGMPQLGVSQLLETSGLPSARRRAAEMLQQAAQSDLGAAELGLAFDVRAAAIELARAQWIVRIYRESQADIEAADAVVRARVGAGAAPRYDASRIGVALAEARADTRDAEADVFRYRAALDVAVGPEANTLRGEVRIDLASVPELVPLERLSAAIEARPDLASARTRTLAAGASVEVARRSVVQGVNVYAGSVVGAGTGNNNEIQVDLSLGVSVPLAIVDRGQGTIPAAERRAEAARYYADAAVLAARQRLAAAWSEVQQRRTTEASFLLTESEDLRAMRHEAEVGYREGRLSILELVDAYTSYRDARLRGATLSGDARSAEVLLGRHAGISATVER